MKKIIAWMFGILLLCSVVAFILIKEFSYFSPSPYSEGDLLLQHSMDDINVMSIVWDKQKVKLKKDNGNWKLRRYFVNHDFFDRFTEKLSDAKIIRETKKERFRSDGYKFIFSRGEQVLQFFQIFPSRDSDKSIVGISGRYYLIDKNLVPLARAEDYYIQPLLSLDGHPIEQSGGFEGDISTIRYKDASQQLPQGDYIYKSFILVTTDGIKVIGGIYQYPHCKWISIQLKTTIMPTIIADEFVNDNNFRYDGWYFLLDE